MLLLLNKITLQLILVSLQNFALYCENMQNLEAFNLAHAVYFPLPTLCPNTRQDKVV